MNNLLNTPMVFLVDPVSIKNGDHNAFLAAYNGFHIKIFRFFHKKTHSAEIAGELTQQTYIRLWQFRHTLSDAYPLEKQLFIIAHSLLVNHFEKETAQKKLKQHQVQEEKLCPYAQDQRSSFELSDRLHIAIDALPPVRKKVIILKAFHDYSNKEIAQQMEISVKTVEDHITRAFRLMKQLMALIAALVVTCLPGGGQA
ncbi:MAG: RNA polymerase sigma factor [Chitinophagaceae bacterium]